MRHPGRFGASGDFVRARNHVPEFVALLDQLLDALLQHGNPAFDVFPESRSPVRVDVEGILERSGPEIEYGKVWALVGSA